MFPIGSQKGRNGFTTDCTVRIRDSCSASAHRHSRTHVLHPRTDNLVRKDSSKDGSGSINKYFGRFLNHGILESWVLESWNLETMKLWNLETFKLYSWNRKRWNFWNFEINVLMMKLLNLPIAHWITISNRTNQLSPFRWWWWWLQQVGVHRHHERS